MDRPSPSRPLHRRRSAWGVGLAVGLAVALLAAACGGGSESSSSNGTVSAEDLPSCPVHALDGVTQPVDLVVWHGLVAKTGETMQALADQYNASQSKVRVHMENQASSYEELRRKFISGVPSKQLPGIYVGEDTDTQLMADSGVVVPAQACAQADDYDLSPFLKTARDYYSVNGVLWAASANPASALVFYNKNHFRRAGLDPDKPPTTLAEIRDDSEKIKAAGVVGTPFVHELASWKTEFLLTGAGAPVVNNDNGRSSQATQGALESDPKTSEIFDWFAQMQADGLMTAIPNAEGQFDQYLALANQKASILLESSSAATSIEAFLSGSDLSGLVAGSVPSDLSSLDIGAGAFPGLEAPGRTQMGGGAWYITNTGPPEVQAAAWDFIKFINGEQAQTQLLTEGSYLPYRVSVADTPTAQQFFDASLSGRWLKIANQQIDDIDPDFPGPLIGPYAETRISIRDALTNLLLQGKSTSEVLATADAEITDALGRYAQGGF